MGSPATPIISGGVCWKKFDGSKALCSGKGGIAAVVESWSSKACFSVSCRLSCTRDDAQSRACQKISGQTACKSHEGGKDYAALVIGHCCAYILDLEQFLLFSQLALENLNVFLIVHQCQTGLRARVCALNSSSVERFNEGAAIARVRSTSGHRQALEPTERR